MVSYIWLTIIMWPAKKLLNQFNQFLIFWYSASFSSIKPRSTNQPNYTNWICYLCSRLVTHELQRSAETVNIRPSNSSVFCGNSHKINLWNKPVSKRERRAQITALGSLASQSQDLKTNGCFTILISNILRVLHII